MPWKKPKKKFDMLDYLPWYKARVATDENGNAIYFKTPFECVVTNFHPSKLFAAFPNYLVFVVGICIGGYLGMSADRAAIQADPEAAACMKRAGAAALERMLEQNAFNRKMDGMNEAPKSAP